MAQSTGKTSSNPVRGMQDHLADMRRSYRVVTEIARKTVLTYGYEEISTPILERVDLFARSLGETSDVVSKEMYAFTDKSGENICLRPENTAGVMRALYAGNVLQGNALTRAFYHGPMFRYERPQKGRLRQFHQIGVELVGGSTLVQADIEVIACGFAVLEALGLAERVQLELNTLGNAQSRASYRMALVDYFSGHRADLSDESKTRLAHNPLRILDSKDAGDRKLLEAAPVFSDYLDAESVEFFDALCAGLQSLNLDFQLNTRLVRGLDYYCHTAFEFTTEDLGAQSAVLAGGRYDGLAEQLGLPATAGIGWAAGVERLAMMMADPAQTERPVALIILAGGEKGSEIEAYGQRMAMSLRHSGIRVEGLYQGNLGKRLRQATRINARAALIIGEEEMKEQTAQIRWLDKSQQESINYSKLIEALRLK